jgi:hypothetical protein
VDTYVFRFHVAHSQKHRIQTQKQCQGVLGKQSFVSLALSLFLVDNMPMGISVYEVAGGYHAEDEAFFGASFGVTEDDAKEALEGARERVRRIEAKLAALPEDDEPLTAAEREAIREASAQIARGEFRVDKV